MRLIKLIAENELLSVIDTGLTEEDIKRIFLDAVFRDFSNYISQVIVNTKLDRPHLFRFKIQVHAEEYNKE